MHRKHFRAAVLCLTALFVIISSVVRAQTNAGTIRGHVLGVGQQPMARPVRPATTSRGSRAETTTPPGSLPVPQRALQSLRAACRVQGYRPPPSIDVRGRRPHQVVLALEHRRPPPETVTSPPSRRRRSSRPTPRRPTSTSTSRTSRARPPPSPPARWSRSSPRLPASRRTRTAASTSRAPTARANTSSTARRSRTRPASRSRTPSIPASRSQSR